MNSVFGSGGSTNAPDSSKAAPINDTSAALARSRPVSATVSPPIRCMANWSGSKSASRARISSTSDQPTVYSEATSSISRCRPASLAASASASRSERRNTSTPRSRMRATNWSCSCWARSTHSTSSNSKPSWFDGVRRCRLRSGRWTITLRSLPTSECTPKSLIRAPLTFGWAPHWCRHGPRRSSRCPPVRRSRRALPVASTKRAAASTFGPIDPAAKSSSRSSSGVTRSSRRCSGVPHCSYTLSTSVAITNRSASTSRASSSLAKSLSMTASMPPRVRSWSGTHVVGIPPPPAQITTTPCSRSHRMGRISKIRFGAGDGTTRRSRSPSRLNTHPFSAASASASASS